MSDHFGVIAYVDQSRMHSISSKGASVAVRSRRAQLVAMKDPLLS